MNFSAWSIRNPVPTLMLFVLLTLGGLFAFHQMKVQNFPDIEMPMVTVVAALPGVLLSLLAAHWWRRALVALGFPLSLALSGSVALPAWAWLLPVAMLVLIYPLHSWRDAPLFPTPMRALAGLAQLAPLPPGAKPCRKRMGRVG